MSPVSLLLLLLLAVPNEPAAVDVPRLESAKNVGLAALEEGNLDEARRRFETVRQLAPSEALGWANGAVTALRAKDAVAAKELLAEALRRAPDDARVLSIEGTRRELAGDFAGAVEACEKAAAADPADLVSRWSAARLLSEKIPAGSARAIRMIESALERAPSNLFLLARLSELRRNAGDAAGALEAHDRLARALEDADARLEKYLNEARQALTAGDAHAASLKYRIVENLLKVSPRYQQARHDVEPGVLGLPLEDWSPPLAVKVRARAGRPLPVSFAEAPRGPLSALAELSAVRSTGRDGRNLVFAGKGGLVVALRAPGGYRAQPPLAGSFGFVETADVTNSGRFDFVAPGALWVAGSSGWRRTDAPGGEAAVPIDFDNDGDLDLFFSSGSGDRLMRNNLDGTWTDTTRAAGLPRGIASRGAVAGDFDRDGDPDLVVLRSGGGLALLDNLRGGRFAEKGAGLPREGAFQWAAAGDLDADGRLDLVWARADGAFTAKNRGDGTFSPARALPASGKPLLADFDNDGFLDLLLASPGGPSAALRGDGAGGFARWNVGALPAALDAEAVDFDGDGDLDAVFVTGDGRAALFENRGGNANGWMDVALEGLPTGSAKVNRAGYGSEVEVKAQELYVYRVANRAVTHLGLGGRRKPEVLRVVWTNGIPQNELSPRTRTLVKEVQQLKGSCPFLYAFDGRRWRFVTDVLGNSPLGLLYDGVHQAPADTREWLLVKGRDLAPSGGRLSLELTEELWEAAYVDLARLAAVDHPHGAEIVPTSAAMTPPPFPEDRLFTISRPFVPDAVDGAGRDRRREIAETDGVFVGGFAPSRYQGIVAPHDLVLTLPRARAAKRVMLYLTGWIFYSDTSIQVSLSQRGAPDSKLRPSGPVLEVPDGRGGWKVAMPAMGFPAGKTKTMPVDLSDVLVRNDPRVRIRTNLAIYWDRIVYTADDPPAQVRMSAAPLASARLAFRGFSRRVRESADAPHVFLHDDVDTAPRWADMAGLYTRYGDVRELLTAADDRYVVFKAGDAIRIEYDASRLPAVPAGWERDWLVVVDGWEKDGDKNTIAGQTVEPLPFHGQDDARYGESGAEPPALRELRRKWLKRREGPEKFRDWIRGGAR
ncbi:MAG TPA: FG-GAP-like repeat-containing protein [Thermoanaerobaculia bacterium]|nr:FG-GAP-like repeat-containing protein [Thermoanaerobaculia bacterium]